MNLKLNLVACRSVLSKIILLIMLMITSCINAPDMADYKKVKINGVEKYLPIELLGELPDFEPKKDNDNHSDESATEHLEHELVDDFTWLAKVSGILAVILGAAGIAFPGFGKLGIGRWLGLVSLCSIGALYFIPYFPFIFGTAAFLLFAYLIWKLYRIFKEKVELEKLTAHLSIADREESQDIMKAHMIKRGEYDQLREI